MQVGEVTAYLKTCHRLSARGRTDKPGYTDCPPLVPGRQGLIPPHLPSGSPGPEPELKSPPRSSSPMCTRPGGPSPHPPACLWNNNYIRLVLRPLLRRFSPPAYCQRPYLVLSIVTLLVLNFLTWSIPFSPPNPDTRIWTL